MRGEFYRMEHEAWDEGTDALTLEQEAAYLRLCHQMYRRRGAIPDTPATLARIWRCHPNKARKLLDDLLASGKVTRTTSSRLSAAASLPDLRFVTREAIPGSLRAAVFRRDGKACCYCGGEIGSFEIDHVVPWSRGGTTDFENLMIACRPCNHRKGAKLLEEWA